MTRKIEPITTPPGEVEMQIRLKKVRGLMQKHGLDCYVAAHTDNVYYLTNFAYIPFERPFFLVVPADGKPSLIVPLLEVDHAEQRILIDADYHTYYEYPAPAGKTFVDVLKKVIPNDLKVGIESSLSIAMQQTIPGKLNVIDVVDDARLVKTDYEVGRVAYASKVVDLGMEKVFELAKPETAMATLYSDATREMMAKTVFEIPDINLLVSNFLAAVWPKALSAQPHAVPGLFDTMGEGGPHVSIVTAQTNGYSAEVERTFFIQHAPDEARAVFDVAMAARELAFTLVKPGARAADVDEAVLQLIKDNGYEKNILHRTGHGFGITGHEPPWIALGSDNILEKNMLISIEPGIYIEGTGGFRHSDTVLVTEDGCVSLTDAPDKLEDLILPV